MSLACCLVAFLVVLNASAAAFLAPTTCIQQRRVAPLALPSKLVKTPPERCSTQPVIVAMASTMFFSSDVHLLLARTTRAAAWSPASASFLDVLAVVVRVGHLGLLALALVLALAFVGGRAREEADHGRLQLHGSHDLVLTRVVAVASRS